MAIRNFAEISKADRTFGDLTVAVGAQGTGKSLALQWLKAAVDDKRVVKALADLISGTGMGGAWTQRVT